MPAPRSEPIAVGFSCVQCHVWQVFPRAVFGCWEDVVLFRCTNITCRVELSVQAGDVYLVEQAPDATD